MLQLCRRCRAPIPGGATACPKCGQALETGHAPGSTPGDRALPEGILSDADGTLHWRYEQDMWKHPVALFLVIKILYAIGAGIGLLMLIVCALDGDFESGLEFFAIVAFGISTLLAVLALFAWGIMSWLRGGKYCYEFDMNEEMVVNRMTAEESREKRKWAKALIFLSLFSRNGNAVGNAALAFTPEVLASRYEKVKSIEAVRKHDLIKVNETLSRNQIYASPAQYDFVRDYIVSRCPHAEIK